jgi:Activator of Hsp90 ATPase homolog 1-like protein
MSNDYTTSLTVDQTPKEVYAAILTVDDWWKGRNEGTFDQVGGEFVHRDGDSHYCRLRVTELDPGRKISWLVLENRFGPVGEDTEWAGTQITFEIAEAGGRTQVHFAHLGLSPEFECFQVCSNAWAFLVNGSLRNLITKVPA